MSNADLYRTRQGIVDERFKDIYQTLYEIRNQLERISLTQAWSLRETDLYDYQRRLDRIDESRVKGNFEAPDGSTADLHTQRVRSRCPRAILFQYDVANLCHQTLIYLLRRSYAYIYSCMISSEPVSEALLPVFNQLQTLRRCLQEVKRSGGVSSPRELYPYTMKVNLPNHARKYPVRTINANPITKKKTANINRHHARRRQIPDGRRIPRGAKHRQRPPERMFRPIRRVARCRREYIHFMINGGTCTYMYVMYCTTHFC